MDDRELISKFIIATYNELPDLKVKNPKKKEKNNLELESINSWKVTVF